MLNGTKWKQQHPRCGKLYTSHNPVLQQPRDTWQRKTVRDTHTHRQSQKETEEGRRRSPSKEGALDWEKHPELAPLVVFLFQEMGAPFFQFWEKSPLLPPPPAPVSDVHVLHLQSLFRIWALLSPRPRLLWSKPGPLACTSHNDL